MSILDLFRPTEAERKLEMNRRTIVDMAAISLAKSKHGLSWHTLAKRALLSRRHSLRVIARLREEGRIVCVKDEPKVAKVYRVPEEEEVTR